MKNRQARKLRNVATDRFIKNDDFVYYYGNLCGTYFYLISIYGVIVHTDDLVQDVPYPLLLQYCISPRHMLYSVFISAGNALSVVMRYAIIKWLVL